jgi:hypothetical protein
MRHLARGAIVALLLFVPSLASAQATLTGTVRDGSGGVLPGVTVEAASPALIEKVRSAVTDGTGQYRIIDLRPGTYSLTFTLPGFTTVKRENLELAGTQTLTISVDLTVGGLAETITVTGETPVVDVQNARRETIIKADVIEQLPVTRAAGAILNITPGINVNEGSAGALSPTMTSFSARSSTINSGSVSGEGRYAMNGFPVTAARSGGFASIVYDTVNVDEVNITVGGGLGESDIGGPIMNIIQRDVSLLGGIAAKLAVVDLAALDARRPVEGREIAYLTPPLTVDNMEALGITRESEQTIVWLASDDNYFPLQRTLLMKFALRE